MTLWDWSLAAWRRPGVEAAALARQDGAGESIALILWRAWAGEAADGVLGEAEALASVTETEVLTHLRAARRALKTSPLPEAETLRGQVRTTELAAERALLDALARLAPGTGDDSEAGFARLKQALAL